VCGVNMEENTLQATKRVGELLQEGAASRSGNIYELITTFQ